MASPLAAHSSGRGRQTRHLVVSRHISARFILKAPVVKDVGPDESGRAPPHALVQLEDHDVRGDEGVLPRPRTPREAVGDAQFGDAELVRQDARVVHVLHAERVGLVGGSVDGPHQASARNAREG